METLSRLVFTFVLNALWQVILVTALTAIAARLLQRAPARYRHALWVMGLGLAVLLPLMSLPDSLKLASRPALAIEIMPAESASVPLRTEVARSLPGGASGAMSARGQSRFLLMNPFRHHSRPIALPPYFVYAALSLYLFSLFCHLARLARAWTSSRKLRREAGARELPEAMALLVTQCRAALGLETIAIRSSSQVTGPVTVGFFKPVIILPEALFQAAPSEELTSALCHEMAHVRRRDYLLNLICEFLFWPLAFHPAAWLLKRRIEETRELACDEAAAGRLLSPMAYARSLVSLAQSIAPLASTFRPRHTLGVFDANILEERIMRLLDKRPQVSARRARLLLGGATLALAVAALTAGGFSLTAEENAKATNTLRPRRDFSGRWELDKSRSELPSPAPDDLVEVIDHHGSELKVTTTSKDWNTSKPIAVTLFALLLPEFSTTTDNKECIQQFGPGQIRSKTHWEDSNLVTEWTLERNGQVAVTGRWVRHLSEDGKTQTVDITGHDPIHNLDGEAKAVFVKREENSAEVPGGVRGSVSGSVAGGIVGGVAGGVAGGVVRNVSGSARVRAEAEIGTISGTVFDPSGARVPQAEVAILNKATGARDSAEANDTGEFSFTGLQPGKYTLSVTKSGFGIYARTVVLTSQKAAPPLDIVLLPGDVLQAIDVTATRAPAAASVPSKSGPQRIRVGGLIEATKLVTMKKPEYPESARARGIEGVVLLQAVISIEGEPLSLKVISSPDPALSKAAEDAVHQWRYEPTLLNGEPIEVVTTVAVRFHLEG